MDNPNPTVPETETEAKRDIQLESQPEQPENGPMPGAEPNGYVNEKIRLAFNRAKSWSRDVRESYRQSPRLQKVTYQGKFMPAFWTVTAIFSLLVNILLIAVLISVGRNIFTLKTLVADAAVKGLSDNLAMMDKAHIVTTVPVQTTVQLKDSLPVFFDVPIQQDTPVTLTEDTVVNATTIINGATVPLVVTLPGNTPLELNMDMTIPVSKTVPVDLTVPVSVLVPLDVAVEQTDLHQSIVGLQNAIEPYKAVSSTFNSAEDISFCNRWWSGWLCDVFLGQ